MSLRTRVTPIQAVTGIALLVALLLQVTSQVDLKFSPFRLSS